MCLLRLDGTETSSCSAIGWPSGTRYGAGAGAGIPLHCGLPPPKQSSASHELLILKLTSQVADKVGCASQTKVAFRLLLVLSMRLPHSLAPSANLPWPPHDPGAGPITSVRLRPIANLAGTLPVPWPPITSGTGDAPGRFSTQRALLQAHRQCRAPLSRSHVPFLKGTLPITSDRLRLGPILYTTHLLSISTNSEA